jgi:hypothetical protein
VTAFEQYSQTTVPIEIHIAWWATAGVTESGGQFQRQARFEGTIISPGCAFFNLASDYQSHLVSRSAYIFSSREPKPRY